MKVIFEDLGVIDYKEAWDYQEHIHKKIVVSKSSEELNEPLRIIFCQHPHVYTLGKSGDESNLLINKNILKSVGAEFYKIDRGGDITYHGPGQLVGYPILDLEQLKIGVKNYIFNLEESIIKTLKVFNIEASRLNGATGVWLDSDNPGKKRKICAIGVRISKFVTMHGFALNVNTNLNYFNYINPCGFLDSGVTSMEKEIGYSPDIDSVKNELKSSILELFGFEKKVWANND